MFGKLQQLTIIILMMTAFIAMQSMENAAYWYIQTNDNAVTKISKKNMKKMIRLDALARLSCPVNTEKINCKQLCLLNDAVSASKTKNDFHTFYQQLQEDDAGDLFKVADVTGSAKIISLMGTCIFPIELQKLIIADYCYKKGNEKIDNADVRNALLTKIPPTIYASYTAPQHGFDVVWHPKRPYFLSREYGDRDNLSREYGDPDKLNIVVRDSNTGNSVQKLEILKCTFEKAEVQYSSDGAFMISKTNYEVVVWDGDEIGKKIKTITTTNKIILSVAMSPNNELLVIGADDKLMIWNCKTDEVIEKNLSCICANVILFHPITGHGFIVGGKGYKEHNLTWRDENGEIIQNVSDCDGNVECAAFSSDGSRFAVGHMGHGGKDFTLRNGMTREKIVTLQGPDTDALHLLFSPDNKYLIGVAQRELISGIGLSTGPSLIVWDAHSGKLLKTGSLGNCRRTQQSFTSDSSLFFASTEEQTRVYDGKILDKNLKRMCTIKEELLGHSPDGFYVATAPFEPYKEATTVHLWKLVSDKVREIFNNRESDLFYAYRFNALCRKLGLQK